MHRFKSRVISVLTVIAMVALLVPVMPASAVLTDSGGGGVPTKLATADTQVTREGIRVKVMDMPRDVTGIDIFRSTAAGVEGDKLNAKPIEETSFMDSSVKPATTYYYTVKVVSRSDKQEAGRFDMLDVLPQVSATSAEAKAADVEAKSAAPSTSPRAQHAKVGASAANSSPGASEAQVSAMTRVIGSAGQVTTMTSNWTWTTAMSPILIRGDLVVPAGKTLTIQPGVKVYFDTIASGTSADVKDNPTSKVDLIVHGKLLAQGTATARVRFSSIMSLPASSVAPVFMQPIPGDWGAIFCDSKAASVVSYCQIEYGEGCWSRNTCRPYYTSNIMHDLNTGTKPWGAILFEQPRADTVTPRIRIVGNSIATAHEGIMVYSVDNEANYSARTGDLISDPYIAGNSIKGDYCIDIEAWDDTDAAGNGNSYVRGTIANNRLMSTQYEPVYLYADTYDGFLAKVSTALSGNVITCPDDDGVYAEAYAREFGSGYVVPTFTGDRINSYNQAFYGEAYSITESSTAVGNAYVNPKFTNCQLTAADDDGVYLWAETESKGTATANGRFIGGRLETANCEGIDAEADSKYGAANASPSFTNVIGYAHDACEMIYADASSDGAGKATSNPRWVGGSMVVLDDDAINASASSAAGAADCKPYVANTTISCYDYAVYVEADSNTTGVGTGTADVSGVLSNCTMTLADDCSGYYGDADAGSTGKAYASPTITNTKIRGYVDDGIELYSYADDGASYCSPVITGSSISAYDHGIYCYADREPVNPAVDADVVCSPVVSHTSARGTDAESLYAEAYNPCAGDALSKPRIHASSLVNTHDDGGFYGEADKDSGGTNYAGNAVVAPVVDYSTVSGLDDYSIEMYAYGPKLAGSWATVGGSVKYSTIDNPYDDCFYVGAYNNGGTAQVVPTLQKVSAQALDDYALYMEAYSSGSATEKTLVAPTITSVNANRAADGFYFQAGNDYDTLSPVTCAPKISGCSIYATWDYPVYANAYTNGRGDVTNSTYIYGSSLIGYDCVDLEANGYGTAGNAYNNSKVLGVSSAARAVVEAFDDDGIYNVTRSDNGDAVDRSQTKYLKIDAQYDAVESSVDAADVATITTSAYGNVIGTKWTGDGDGVYIDCEATDAFIAPSIKSNSIGAVTGDGIDITNSSTNTKFSPNVSLNSIGGGTLGVGGDGIYFSNSTSTHTAGEKATIYRNTIRHPFGTGMTLENVNSGLVQGNKVYFPAFGNPTEYWTDSAGIYWQAADHTLSSVKGNLVVDASHAVLYRDGWAVTNYNSFAAGGRTNRPWNLGVRDVGSPKVDARYNWWGTTNSAKIAESINADDVVPNTVVDYSSPLTVAPVIP